MLVPLHALLLICLLNLQYNCKPHLHAGHSNGDLLFQFDGARGPETGVSLGSMSVGQQWQVMVKLRKLTQGEEAELSYQLWQEWPAVDASDADSDSVSTSEQHATNASANASEDGAHQAATQSTLGSSMNDSTAASSKAGSSNSSQAAAQQGEDFVMHAFAQALLSTSGRPAENDEQVTPGTNGYSAASSRQWYSPHIELVSADGEQASPHQSQQNSIDDDRGARRHDAHKYASHRTSSAAHSQDDFTSPPVDFPWPRTLTPKERSVPCYMWHAAGPPTHVSLTHSKPQATADGNEAEFHSDDSAAPDTSTAEYDTFPTRSQLLNIPDDGAQGGLLGLLRPVLHLALQLWRRLPYWFRRLLQFGRKPRGPLLHASPILSQHIRTGRRTEVPGSSFNPATG